MKKLTPWMICPLSLVLMLASCAPLSTPTAVPTALPAPVSTAVPDDWGDRSIYRDGLISSEQGVLDELPGASIYHISVMIGEELTSLQGQERIRYTNQEEQPLEEIYFQLYPNMLGGSVQISAASVNDQPVQAVPESGNTTLRMPLTSALQPGESCVLQLDFMVNLPTEPGGNYGLLGYMNDILTLDGFYPSIPVHDAQGWHAGPVQPNADTTFNDVSFYRVQVQAPESLVLVSSGIAVESSSQDGWQKVTFAAGPARDFYLTASEKFQVLSTSVGETQVNSYAFKNNTRGAQLALNTAASAITHFSARFGAYPYTEFDVASTSLQGAYGIEYPGMTGINRELYEASDDANFTILEATVAHEVGHQWFYNLVGNDQGNEPWLDEAVTQYVTGLYFLDQYGAEGMSNYRASWFSRWDRVEQAGIPIGLEAGDYKGREYGAIVYGRGPLFVAALKEKMGSDAFDALMRDYCQAYHWQISSAAGFRQLAEEHCQCDLTDLFKAWVDE